MKTKFTLLWMIALALLLETSAFAQRILLRADLAVTNLTVTNVNGNSATFNYTVQNVGNASLDLSRLFYQTYVSTNSTYETTDLPAGGAIFGNAAPTLAPGATYSGSWTSSNSAGLTTYHYLIFEVKLRSGYTSQETNLTNNILSKDIAPSFADLVVTNITVTNIDGNTMSYTYTIANNGASTLYLDRFYFQAYVSQNSLYDATDVPAGGSIFGYAPLTLAPGATFTGSWSDNPGVSLQTYPYLIFDVRLSSGQVHPQLSVANDRYVKYLLPSFADLVISDITVTNIDGNTMYYTYTIANNGASTLYLDRFYFQAYVSQDNVYDATDVPAGGSIFGSAPLTLAPGATFTGSWSDNPGVSLQTYPYLVFDVRLLSGQVHPQISLTNDRYVKYLLPSFADLVVSDITVTDITGNNVSYNYTITNNGGSTLYLDRFYFQAYVSQNSLYDATDVPAGGSIFGYAPLTLAPGASFTGSWSDDPGVSLQTYPYLIFDVRLLSGQVQPQISLTNDRFVKYLPYSFTDLVVTSISTSPFNPSTSVDFTYTVSNGGQTNLHLNQFYFQTYLSTDNVYDNLDKPAGGSIFPTNAVLATGDSYSGSWTSSAGVSIQSYPYLIYIVRTVYGQVVNEVSTANNQYIKYIPLVFFQNFDNSLTKSAAFKAEKANDVLTLENTADVEEPTAYILYSVAGEKITEGSFIDKKEINTASLKNGIYILNLSNGSDNESVKFIVQK